MPLFSVVAVKVTPQVQQVQPLPPLEEIVVEPTVLLAADEERAKLALAKKIPEGVDLNLVKYGISQIALK